MVGLGGQGENLKKKWGWGVGSGGQVEGQGRCERRGEVFVKI